MSTSKSLLAAALPTPLAVAASCATATVTFPSTLALGVTPSVQTWPVVVSVKVPLAPLVTDTSDLANPVTTRLKVRVTVKASLVLTDGPVMVRVGRALLFVTVWLFSAAASLPMASVSWLVEGLT